MKTKLIAAVITGALTLTSAHAQNYPARFMGGEAKLITAPNGAVVYDKSLAAAASIIYTEKVVEKITEGVWVIGGYSAVNCIVIAAPQGLIVYDTGDYAEEGKHFRDIIAAEISKKPIKAIIYSHSHYALGGGTMVDDPKSVTVIGHPKLNDTVKANLQGGGAPSAIAELGPVLTARAAVQFSNFLPLEGPDATLAARIETRTPAFLPVTQPVEDGQTLEVAGLKLQFFTKHLSDDYSVTVWVPEKKVCLNNFFWPGTPNLYSLRGAVFRDPQAWRDGLKVIRDLQPEFLGNTHARAVKGKDAVASALMNYMDLITLTYDQSLRGILQGLGPDDLRYFIYKPKHLAESPYNAEAYGETVWFPQAVFYYQMGWFDRDPTKMYQLPPQEEAKRLVTLMGGGDKVLAAAKESLAKNEYAWAAQLVNYLYKLDPNDAAVRQLKADALRKLGQLSMGSIGRSFLISEARGLEGKEQIPRNVPPNAGSIAADPATFVNLFRVRIDPQRAESTDAVLTFTFTGQSGQTVGLHVRKGVAEFLADPTKHYRKPDIALSMDGAAWANLYLSATGLKEAIDAGKVKVTAGDGTQAAAIFDFFDKFQPARNVTIPALHD